MMSFSFVEIVSSSAKGILFIKSINTVSAIKLDLFALSIFLNGIFIFLLPSNGSTLIVLVGLPKEFVGIVTLPGQFMQLVDGGQKPPLI